MSVSGNRAIGQSGEEFSDGHKENQPFVLSDLIFLYGMMDALEMQQVHCPNKKGPGSTSGLLVDEAKWASSQCSGEEL